MTKTRPVMEIKDIKTENFNRILDDLRAEGWKVESEYNGFDAWIDYGNVTLLKEGERLNFEWDNWFEGIIRGPESHLRKIAQDYGLPQPKDA